MTRAVLAGLVVLLAACQAGAGDDYPPRPGGGGPVIIGGGGTVGDAGVGDSGAGEAPIPGRVCILKDLRHLTDCDTAQDASRLTVMLGTQSALGPPTKLGDFEVPGQHSNEVFWHVSGATVITSVMRYGTDNTIPVVPDDVYTALLGSNSVTIPAEGQGSVVVRVVNGGAPAAGVTAKSTLVSNNVVPRYDADNSAVDWREVGPTQTSGVLWFPGVQVTTNLAQITLTPSVGAPVDVNDVTVETLAITFVTRDVK